MDKGVIMKFERIGESIDNAIIDIINWYLKSFVYKTYARYTIKKYIRKQIIFESKEHLDYTLEHAIKNGWFNEEEAYKLADRWDDVNATN